MFEWYALQPALFVSAAKAFNLITSLRKIIGNTDVWGPSFFDTIEDIKNIALDIYSLELWELPFSMEGSTTAIIPQIEVSAQTCLSGRVTTT